jgi:hypothetical protein
MAGTICGAQYTGKTCECRLQVTPGKTPATGEAANPARICSFVEYGVQYPCDPGCCSTDCATATTTNTTESSDSLFKKYWYWWIILIGIVFGLLIFGSFVYRSTRKK